MYRPNFCAECGAKVLRLRWNFWTSRKFCDACARRLRQVRFVPPLLAAVALMGLGVLTGRIRRPAAPPLTIIRRADSPLSAPEDPGSPKAFAATTGSGTQPSSSATPEEEVYICGARTKKGTPCSRRVHGPKRCWQHKGMPAMMPQEKLLVKE